MPIPTPEDLQEPYNGDKEHFTHVLDHLFIPAIEKAGFHPIAPATSGSDIIQEEIIKHLSQDDLVLCDMSMLNPNVFFKFGIRTALDKPAALIVDDITDKVPFDTSIIDFHRYKSSLSAWVIENEINNLAKHIEKTYSNESTKNALWKYFGVAQTGVFKQEEATIGNKLDYLMKEVASLKEKFQGAKSSSNNTGFIKDLSCDQPKDIKGLEEYLEHADIYSRLDPKNEPKPPKH